MVQFRVRAESLAEVAGLLGSVIATFDGNISSVDSQVQNALQNWKGDDAESFQQNWSRFVALSEQVRLSLTGLQNGLISAGVSYDTTESGLRQGMAQTVPSVQGLRKHAVQFEEGVARGEARAEDMAEFFGRDYAGDDEVERFGGGALGGSKGRYTGGGSGDTDGDGDDDAIGTTPFLSDESVEELYGDDSELEAGFVETEDGVQQVPEDDAAPEDTAPEAETDGSADAREDAREGAVFDGEGRAVPADLPPADLPPADGSSIHAEAVPAEFERPAPEQRFEAESLEADGFAGEQRVDAPTFEAEPLRAEAGDVAFDAPTFEAESLRAEVGPVFDDQQGER